MVVLAASICTRGGKPVISRQFREMPRSRVEALLNSFPKLISATSGAQHTSVETETVRYVYQPLEDLYMILITNKSSNILQDIDTLHLFARTVADMCRGLDERDILRNSFELLGAFDEIVSLGYRENVTLAQIRNILEMESHEEKIQEIIERNKELEAKEELKRRAKQLEMQRREAARRGQMGGAGGFGAGGVGGGVGGFGPGGVASRFDSPASSAPVVRDTGVRPAAPAAAPFKSKGMQLGKKGKSAELLGAMGESAAVAPAVGATAAGTIAKARATGSTAEASTSSSSAAAGKADALDRLPERVEPQAVHLVTRERVTVRATRDGTLSSLEVKGDLELRVTDAAFAKIRIHVAPHAAPDVPEGSLTFKTHPHVDRAAWSERREISLRDAASKPFPLRQNLGVLRWRAAGLRDESLHPLALNVWTSPSGDGSGACDVTLDYDANVGAGATELLDVHVTVPLPEGVEPSDVSTETGDHELVVVSPETGAYALQWRVGDISAERNASASLEFRLAAGCEDVEVLFPVRVDFVSRSSICGVQVASVEPVEASTGEVPFSTQTVVSVEEFTVA